jgi:hypothetical protein
MSGNVPSQLPRWRLLELNYKPHGVLASGSLQVWLLIWLLLKPRSVRAIGNATHSPPRGQLSKPRCSRASGHSTKWPPYAVRGGSCWRLLKLKCMLRGTLKSSSDPFFMRSWRRLSLRSTLQSCNK